MMKEEKPRFKVETIIYIGKWFGNQPRNTVVKGKIVATVDKSILGWIKYEMVIIGRKQRFLIGDFKSPDVWSARIYKNSKKEIYKV